MLAYDGTNFSTEAELHLDLGESAHHSYAVGPRARDWLLGVLGGGGGGLLLGLFFGFGKGFLSFKGQRAI